MKEEKEQVSGTKVELSSEASEELQGREGLHATAQAPIESSEVERLKTDLAATAGEMEKYRDLYLRERAEIENFKKRMQREKPEALRYENERLIRELLPTIDNLDRALRHGREKGEGEALHEGVAMVLKTMLDALQGFGMSQIHSVGEPFDPEKHEAIAYVETDQPGPSMVIEEHQKGYFYKDRLLRAAMVTVSRPQMAKKESETSPESGSVEKPHGDG